MSAQSIIKYFLVFFLFTKGFTYQNNLDHLPDISKKNIARPLFSADFLAWYASEEPTSIWADEISSLNWGAPSFHFKWDYGFRLGTGYDLNYDSWDTTISWTWFRTESTHKIRSDPGTTISPEFFAGNLFLSSNIPQSMQVRWSLLLNMFDWELGRNYSVSPSIQIRPFLGIKGGWIDQSIRGHYSNLTILIFPTNNSGKEHLKNNFWGIGPIGGLNSKWKIGSNQSSFLDLFGDFSIATMSGNWANSDIYKNTASQSIIIRTKNSSLGAVMFRGFVGIGWDVDFRENKSHFSAKLGYEMQIWSNQLRIATFQLQRLHGDLTLQGLTFNCRLEY